MDNYSAYSLFNFAIAARVDVRHLVGRLQSFSCQAALLTLNPPAKPDTLDAAERTLGFPLPRHVREMYRLFDGQALGCGNGGGGGLLDGARVLSLSEVMERRMDLASVVVEDDDEGTSLRPEPSAGHGTRVAAAVTGQRPAGHGPRLIPLSDTHSFKTIAFDYRTGAIFLVAGFNCHQKAHTLADFIDFQLLA
jgi:cell wall assembly regulator SMI1